MIGVSGRFLLRDTGSWVQSTVRSRETAASRFHEFSARVDGSGPLDVCLERRERDLIVFARVSTIGHAPQHKLDQLVDAVRRERWTALGAIDGDHAFAAYHPETGRLVLGRAPLSSFPFFYRAGSREIAFGPLACALAERSSFQPDLVMLAAQHLGTPAFARNRTAFEGIAIVEPGTVVVADGATLRMERYWTPSDWNSEVLSDREAADRLREAMFRAVRKVTSRSHDLASHCSSGRDSSAVTAVAASILAPHRLLSLTAGRGEEGDDGAISSDEVAGARAVSALHPNIDHRLWRGANVDLVDRLETIHRVLHGPFGTPVNLAWWDGLRRIARDNGRNVILTGACGNLTISAGGPWYVGDLLRTGRLPSFFLAYCDAAGFSGASRRNLLNNALGPLLPRGLQRLATAPETGSPFLRGPLREELRRQQREYDPRPPWSFEAARRHSLEMTDMADESNEQAGVKLIDPTIDREVVSASLGLSLAQLASRYDRRPIYERAFGDLLPKQVVRTPVRAPQSADWRTQFDVSRMALAVERFAMNDSVRDLVDIAAVKAALADWPTDAAAGARDSLLYTDRLLPAIALSSFLAAHFPN